MSDKVSTFRSKFYATIIVPSKEASHRAAVSFSAMGLLLDEN